MGETLGASSYGGRGFCCGEGFKETSFEFGGKRGLRGSRIRNQGQKAISTNKAGKNHPPVDVVGTMTSVKGQEEKNCRGGNGEVSL